LKKTLTITLLITGLAVIVTVIVKTTNTDDTPTQSVNTTSSSRENGIITEGIKTVKKSLGYSTDVKFNADNSTFEIISTDKSLNKKLTTLLKDKPKTSDFFDKQVDTIQAISVNIGDVVAYGYSLALMNPNNPTHALLVCQDGNIMYNFLD
jgi:hypothetical protein